MELKTIGLCLVFLLLLISWVSYCARPPFSQKSTTVRAQKRLRHSRYRKKPPQPKPQLQPQADQLSGTIEKIKEKRNKDIQALFQSKTMIELYEKVQATINVLNVLRKTERSETCKEMLYLASLCEEASSRKLKFVLSYPTSLTFLQQLLILNDGREGLYKRTFPLQWDSLMRNLQ